MDLWKRWFTRRASPRVTNPIAINPPASESAEQATCPYCGAEAAQRWFAGVLYPFWKCECGAMSSGASMYQDLDEVADGLLHVLDIPGRVSEPSTPTGNTGMVFLQPYNIPKSLEQLREILRARAFEMQTNATAEARDGFHIIWVRRRSP